jgi:hypothetical protein
VRSLLEGVRARPVNSIVWQLLNVMTDFTALETFLANVPAVIGPIGKGSDPDGMWWVKFGIDIDHELAWRVVQEFGHVLNYVSLDEPLPTVFKPVSPPPYMNGGPREFLSWVIECDDSEFAPSKCAEWLEGRFPRPVDDLATWRNEELDS